MSDEAQEPVQESESLKGVSLTPVSADLDGEDDKEVEVKPKTDLSPFLGPAALVVLVALNAFFFMKSREPAYPEVEALIAEQSAELNELWQRWSLRSGFEASDIHGPADLAALLQLWTDPTAVTYDDPSLFGASTVRFRFAPLSVYATETSVILNRTFVLDWVDDPLEPIQISLLHPIATVEPETIVLATGGLDSWREFDPNNIPEEPEAEYADKGGHH